MPARHADDRRRSGAQTRAHAEQIALRLFSTQGYEATSLQQIADELGIRKASLYYHFRSKDDIVKSLLEGRSNEAQALAEWVRTQPPSPALAKEAVLRWIDSFSIQKLLGIRFMNANPILVRSISERSGIDVGDELSAVLNSVAWDRSRPGQTLLLRMALMSISSAVAAATGISSISDEQITSTARVAAQALLGALDGADLEN